MTLRADLVEGALGCTVMAGRRGNGARRAVAMMPRRIAPARRTACGGPQRQTPV